MKGRGTLTLISLGRRRALCLFVGALSWFGCADAHAACEGFSVAADSCPSGISIKGCCEDNSVAQWCDDGTLCSWDCSKEGPGVVCGWAAVAQTGHYVCQDTFVEDPSGENPSTCDDAMGCPCAGIECGFDYSATNVDSPGCFCGLCEEGLTCETETGKCVCIPSCAGKQCGPDGCGDDCGVCAGDGECTSQGLCTEAGCVGDCAGKSCGGDGCGDVCGQCPENSSCQAGLCVAGCAADCMGKDCGDDGCGGTCGDCLETATCNTFGKCVLNCASSCDGRECGDDGCGGSCGVCASGEICGPAGECEYAEGPCSCAGRVCGDNGCGQSCGLCGRNTVCDFASGECKEATDTTRAMCPPGRQWNRWANACTIDEHSMMAPAEEETSGCEGGRLPQGLVWLYPVLWCLWRHRSRRQAVP